MRRRRLGALALAMTLGATGSLAAQNQAIQLNGSSWIRVADSPSLDISGPLTIECWIRPDSLTGDSRVVGKWGDSGIADRSYALTREGATLNFALSTSAGQSDAAFHNFTSGNLLAGQWQHLACTFDGTTRLTYLNGQLVGSRQATGVTHVGVTDLSIGAALHDNAGSSVDLYLVGTIDEVRIWNTARTLSEIRSTINKSITVGLVSAYPELVSCWNFDGSFGDSTGLNPASPQGSPSFVQADDIPKLFQGQNQALDLDGDGDYVQVMHSPSLAVDDGTFTYECWFRSTSTADASLFEKAKDCLQTVEVLQNSSGDLLGFLRGLSTCSLQGPKTAGLALNDGSWHHVALVKDVAFGYIYVDGQLAGSASQLGASTNTSEALTIGGHLRDDGTTYRYLDGSIDELRIWSVARTQAEILSTINTRITADDISAYPDVVSAWNFDGDALDSAGLNHGSEFGDATYVLADDIPDLVAPAVLSVSPSQAVFNAGPFVTIATDGFSPLGTTFVSFGSKTATNVAWLATDQLVCQVPFGSQGNVVDVTVTQGVLSATLPQAFTYVGTTITGIDKQLGNIDGGTTVTLSADYTTSVADTSVTVDGKAASVLAVTPTSITLETTAALEATGIPVDIAVSCTDGADTLAAGFTYTPNLAVSITGDITAGRANLSWQTDPDVGGPQAIAIWVGNPNLPIAQGVPLSGYSGLLYQVPLLFLLSGFPTSLNNVSFPFGPIDPSLGDVTFYLQALVSGEGGPNGSLTNEVPFVIPASL